MRMVFLAVVRREWMRFSLAAARPLRAWTFARSLSTGSRGGEGSVRVAIIGSGPSGFYTAKYLLNQHPDLTVDMYEKLPFPFGLVRYGVAPDHPEVKSVINQFTELAKEHLATGRFRFVGNTEVSDRADSVDPVGPAVVKVAQLDGLYSAIVFAYGASEDHRLGVLGEPGPGVLTARQLVNWYNGHPSFTHLPGVDLSTVQHVAIVGHGNVALDCARVLAKHRDASLAATDVTSAAVVALRACPVRTITVLGRRGHVQSAFTIKELRELTKLPGVALRLRGDELAAGMTEASAEEAQQQPGKKRILQLMDSIAHPPSPSTLAPSENATATAALGSLTNETEAIQIDVRFLLAPQEIIRRDDGSVAALRCQRNILTGAAFQQRAVPAPGKEGGEEIRCDLVIESVGYRGEPISALLPFDSRSHTLVSTAGRVPRVGGGGTGWYATGWIRRGPSGIIGTNISDARETVAAVLEDVAQGRLPRRGQDPLVELHSAARARMVSWEQVERLHAEEVRRGQASSPQKPREKVTDLAEALVLCGK